MSFSRSAKRWLLYIVYLVVVTLLLLEVGVRLLRPAPLFEAITVTSSGENEYVLSPNPELIYEPMPGRGEFNSDGYRGPIFPVSRTPGKSRIMFIGDSVVEGLGVEPAQRFTQLLGDKLGAGVEVINLAVRGYNLIQEIAYLKQKGLQYHPDQVVFGITFNDLTIQSGEITSIEGRLREVRGSRFYNRYYNLKNTLELKLFHLHSYRYLRYFLDHLTDNTAKEDTLWQVINYVMEPDELRGKLDELQSLAQQNGFELSFVLLPIGETAPKDQIERVREQLIRAGVSFLDLHAAVTSRNDPEYLRTFFLPDDPCHFSADGHQRIAQMLLEGRGENTADGFLRTSQAAK